MKNKLKEAFKCKKCQCSFLKQEEVALFENDYTSKPETEIARIDRYTFLRCQKCGALNKPERFYRETTEAGKKYIEFLKEIENQGIVIL